MAVCQLIMENIEDKNPKDNNGWTPLHYAASNGHLAICQLIMENIEDKNPKENNGWTPLHSAAWNHSQQPNKCLVNPISSSENCLIIVNPNNLTQTAIMKVFECSQWQKKRPLSTLKQMMKIQHVAIVPEGEDKQSQL